MTTTLRQPAADIAAFIRAHDPSEERFNRLALELFAFQFGRNAAFRRFCEAAGKSPGNVRSWADIPAVPTAAFKELELTVLETAERVAVFHSSGTTEQRPSRHFHSRESLAVYEESLLAWFEPHLRLKETPGLRLIVLTPPRSLAPRSSLVHMCETIRVAHPDGRGEFFGEAGADGDWCLRFDELCSSLDKPHPVALFGTAFNFVHLLDGLSAAGRHFALPPGSRLMETGGYKGRSRTLPKEELHAALSATLGVPRDHIVCEYGMSELSSQAYDAVVGQQRNAPRAFRFPPWARFQIISPETGREALPGTPGLLRVFDLANVASSFAVQTEDLTVRAGDGFELLGRAPAVEARGCSLMSA